VIGRAPRCAVQIDLKKKEEKEKEKDKGKEKKNKATCPGNSRAAATRCYPHAFKCSDPVSRGQVRACQPWSSESMPVLSGQLKA
jgi:hypothetical protein